MTVLLFGIVGVLLIQWVVIGKLYSKLDSFSLDVDNSLHLSDKTFNKMDKLASFANNALWSAGNKIESNEQELKYLEDKIDTLLELLIQEHEESVK